MDFRHKGTDHLAEHQPKAAGQKQGLFSIRTNIYGINSRGKVGILVPGCQVWNTVVDEKGKVMEPYDSKIMDLLNGNSSIAMGSTHPHTTRKEVPRCVDCHLDPKALGLGEGVMKFNPKDNSVTVETLYDSGTSGLKIDFPMDAVVDSQGKILQGTSHQLCEGLQSG